MTKCRYDLSEDCSNDDCVRCVLDKIITKIMQVANQEKFHDEMEQAVKYVLQIDVLLEQEPTTKNDLGVDCVDKNGLLKIYEDKFLELQKLKHLKDNKGAEDIQLGVNYCINVLKELPPVMPIRPKGHWIYDKSIDNWICSECHETPKTIGYVGSDAFMVGHFKYCNHCGAKMSEP